MLENRLPHLDLIKPIFGDCATDARVRHTLVEGFIGDAGVDSLLWRRPATSTRVPGLTLREALSRNAPEQPGL